MLKMTPLVVPPAHSSRIVDFLETTDISVRIPNALRSHERWPPRPPSLGLCSKELGAIVWVSRRTFRLLLSTKERPPPRRTRQPLVLQEESRLILISASISDVTRCWWCGFIGHVYLYCQQKSDRRFCYGCGRSDVTFWDYPKCKKPSKKLGPY